MIDNLMYSGFEFNKDEKFLKSKFKLLNSLLLITGFFTILFGILSDLGINELGPVHTYVDYICGVLSFAWVLLLRLSKNNYYLVSSLLVITTFFTFTSALIFVPQDQFRIIWFYLLVYVTYFLLGKRIGFLLSILSILVILLLYNMIDLQLSQIAINSAVLGLFIASLLSFTYINRITEYESDLQDKFLKLNDYKKHLEDEVKDRTKELNKTIALFDANVMALNLDPNGLITYASQELCDIGGYTQDDLLGKPYAILKYKETPDSLYKKLWDTIKSGKIWNGELKKAKKNGGYFWVRESIIPEFDDDGNIIGYNSIKHDISSEKIKEEFMANMNHELRTPLNSIIGFSEILSSKPPEYNHIELSKYINSSSKTLLGLINDILDLSKIHDSNFSLDPFEFDAKISIEECNEKTNVLAEQKDILFINSIDDNLDGLFFGDWSRISQIIKNLVSNALKFTPEHGRVKCESKYIDEHFVFSIEDNGIGMNDEVQNKVFKPFEQADGSTTRKYGGTGLGLSIVQNLIELMNAKLELSSKEGEGTKFIIKIPLKKLQKHTVENIGLEEKQENGKELLNGHVLIVEDNKTNQLLLKMLVEEYGLSCDIANDGVEAVNMYDPAIHSLVFMDENMPNMSGLEAMRKIKKKYKDRTTPIIALTANAMKGDRKKFLELGMDEYISKPIDGDVLYKIIKKLLV